VASQCLGSQASHWIPPNGDSNRQLGHQTARFPRPSSTQWNECGSGALGQVIDTMFRAGLDEQSADVDPMVYINTAEKPSPYQERSAQVTPSSYRCIETSQPSNQPAGPIQQTDFQHQLLSMSILEPTNTRPKNIEVNPFSNQRYDNLRPAASLVTIRPADLHVTVKPAAPHVTGDGMADRMMTSNVRGADQVANLSYEAPVYLRDNLSSASLMTQVRVV